MGTWERLISGKSRVLRTFKLSELPIGRLGRDCEKPQCQQSATHLFLCTEGSDDVYLCSGHAYSVTRWVLDQHWSETVPTFRH